MQMIPESEGPDSTSERSFEQAGMLARALVGGHDGNLEEVLGSIDDPWLTVDDVQADRDDLFLEFDLFDQQGQPAPLLRQEDGRDVPVALRCLPGSSRIRAALALLGPGPRLGTSLEEDALRLVVVEAEAVLARAADELGTPFRLGDTGQAKELFADGAADFLAHRIEALQSLRTDISSPWSPVTFSVGKPHRGAPVGKAPGANFEVETLTPSLNVHRSGAYCRNYRSFGVSTPARGVLPAGTYVFGVEGGRYPYVTPAPPVISLPGPASVRLLL